MSSESQKTILKSTSIIGGAQILKLIFQIIKSKVYALLIGPTGIGLISTFTSAIGIVSNLSGLGIGFSAIREIAKADSSNDQKIIAQSIYALRRLTILLGIIGTSICYFLSDVLSRFTFGDNSYSIELKYLSIIVIIMLVSASQSALIQGKRKIKDLAKLNIYGSAYGVLIGIPFVYFYGLDAIVPMLISVEIMNLTTSWWYARKIKIQKIKLSLFEFIKISKSYIKLGIAVMGGSFTVMLSIYLIRVIIINEINIESVGFYQASFILSSLYVGIVLEAMGKDYFPRLTSSISKNLNEACKLVNDQTQVGLLLALPGLLLTIVLAPLIIDIFYSTEFSISADILRWQILGVFLRVIAWPLVYMFLAKGKGKIYFLTEVFFNSLHIGLIIILVRFQGILGTGVAFFILYIIYYLIMFKLVKKYFEFHWTNESFKLIIMSSFLVAIIFLIVVMLDDILGIMCSSVLTLITTYFCFKKLLIILGLSDIMQFKDYIIKKLKK